MTGILSKALVWARLANPTWGMGKFDEISCSCYLYYVMILTRTSTLITLGWPHVVDTPRNTRN